MKVNFKQPAIVGKATGFVKKHSCFFTTAVEIVGFGTSVILACKETSTAEKLLAEAKKNGEDLDWKETGKTYAKTCWPSAVTFAATSVFTAVRNNHMESTIVNLGIANATLSKFADYQRKALVDQLGEEKTKELEEKAIIDRSEEVSRTYADSDVILAGHGDTLFYDPWTETFFRSNLDFVKNMDLKFADMWQNCDYAVTLNDWHRLICLGGDAWALDYLGWLKADEWGHPINRMPKVELIANKRDVTHGEELYYTIDFIDRPTHLTEEEFRELGY